jgi:dihydropteroate synthase
VAQTGVALVLMHMQGTPQTMQQAPAYGDVVEEVADFLAARALRYGARSREITDCP